MLVIYKRFISSSNGTNKSTADIIYNVIVM